MSEPKPEKETERMKKIGIVMLGVVLAAGLMLAGCKTTDQKSAGTCPAGKSAMSCGKEKAACCKAAKGCEAKVCPKTGEACSSEKRCCKKEAKECGKCGAVKGSDECKAACGKS